MSFCKFSSEKIIKETTDIENIFINEFLPNANGDCVKVYLYGLFLCSHSDSIDNTLDNFSKALNMSKQDVESAFLYWQDQNLVNVLNLSPIEVRYLPCSNAIRESKLKPSSKYSEFVKQVQEILNGRMISVNEFHEYFNFMDNSNVEPNALLMIVKYCTDLKGTNVGYAYILQVAKNWANEGVKTVNQVEDKLKEQELYNDDVKKLLTACKITRSPTYEDRELMIYLKKELSFDIETIIKVAKLLKLKSKNALDYLKNKMTKYYEMQLLTYNDIESYENQKNYYYDCAKIVTKNLGLRFDDLSTVVENYITKWINYGFEEDTLKELSHFSFSKTNTPSLALLDDKITKLYKLGLISLDSITNYINNLSMIDESIKQILSNLKINDRLVNERDRNYYSTWTNDWNLPIDLINYACTFAQNTDLPMNYLNKILSKYHENNISTVDGAKNYKIPTTLTSSSKNNVNYKSFSDRKYTSDELSSLYNNLDNLKI
jgi:DnaD/phage-associated family protein